MVDKLKRRIKVKGLWKVSSIIVLAFVIGYILGHGAAIDTCYEVGKRYVEVIIRPEILEKILQEYGYS